METPESKRGRTNRSRGLAIERKVRDILMKYMNTVAHRIAIRGTAAADVETEPGICPYCLHTECEVELAVEVKSKQTATPAFLKKAFEQINSATLEIEKRPLVVVSYKDGNKRSYYAMFELHDDFDPWSANS
tara:strand:- start:8746 stop:9141 length:396 start_codon:yes stop_codon:yes gene_type:complete